MTAITTAMTLAQPEADLRRRLRPSREQLRIAAAMFRAATEDITSVVVPVAAACADGPVDRGPVTWLEYPGGYWLADRGSRHGAYSFPIACRAAEAAALAHLCSRGERGVPGWVTIRPDGTWTVLDGA
ncbi:MAG TPA: hypothetical protein VI248_28935 [Kineosporiaceae bacterium]